MYSQAVNTILIRLKAAD